MISKSITGLLFIVGLTANAGAQSFNDFEEPPHRYHEVDLNDPMTRLLEEGKVDLGKELDKEPVIRLIEALGIPASSQVLVFSKTSLQRKQVSAENPRGIYFNEEAYVGWIPGGRIEIASFDPVVGPVFFFEDERKEPGPLHFDKPAVCLQCHAGSATNFLPGVLARSVYADKTGRRLRSVEGHEHTHHSLGFEHRWGGWLVTGTYGFEHKGNLLAERGPDGVRMIPGNNKNLKDLKDWINPDRYPAPGSDVLALMIFDHQIGIHDILVEANYRIRTEMFAQNTPFTAEELNGEALSIALKQREKILSYMLFSDEADAGDAKIKGDPAFEKDFRANRRDSNEGQSLKDLHLEGRVFKNRCSYMIYSQAFEGLPIAFRHSIYERLFEILSSEEPTEDYEHLTKVEKERIKRILKDTKTDLPEVWQS